MPHAPQVHTASLPGCELGAGFGLQVLDVCLLRLCHKASDSAWHLGPGCWCPFPHPWLQAMLKEASCVACGPRFLHAGGRTLAGLRHTPQLHPLLLAFSFWSFL